MIIVISIVVVIVGLFVWAMIAAAAREKKLKEEEQRLEEEAEQKLKEDADNGVPKACFTLGVRCLHSNSSLPEARKLLQKALEQGYTEAEEKLELCALREKGMNMEAAEYELRWQKKGDPKADFDWGVKCLESNSKLPEAKRWLQKALEQGYSEAESQLKICAFREEGLSMEAAKRKLEAVTKKEAAGKGNPKADFDWGVYCLDYDKNLPEARQWLQKALEQGYSEAESKLKTLALREAEAQAELRISALMEKGMSRDNAEINARFLEAAIKGTNPRDVVGFKEFEKIPAMRNSSNYTIVKDMCMALVARGYWIEEGSVWKTSGWKGHGGFSVYRDASKMHSGESVGSISLYTEGSYEGVSALELHSSNIGDNRLDGGKFHIIQDFPNIVIDSLTPCYEEPPEWLKICAMVRKKYSPPIKYPNWVVRFPDAKNWVNVAFNDARALAELNEKIYNKQIRDAFEDAVDRAVDKIVNG